MVTSISNTSFSVDDLLNSTIRRTSTMTSSTTSGSLTTEANDLLNTFCKKYTDRYSTNAGIDSDDEKKQVLKSLTSEGDTDGDGSLSLKELYNIDTKGNSEETEVVKSLISQFNSLDKNGDGTLSLDEMQNVELNKQYSIEELSEMAKELKDANNNNSNSGIISTDFDSNSSFESKLINNYTQNPINNTISTITVSA